MSPLERKAVNIADAARMLGLHPHTVRAMVEDGRLYSVRVGKRWLRERIDALHRTT